MYFIKMAPCLSYCNPPSIPISLPHAPLQPACPACLPACLPACPIPPNIYLLGPYLLYLLSQIPAALRVERKATGPETVPRVAEVEVEEDSEEEADPAEVVAMEDEMEDVMEDEMEDEMEEADAAAQCPVLGLALALGPGLLPQGEATMPPPGAVTMPLPQGVATTLPQDVATTATAQGIYLPFPLPSTLSLPSSPLAS